MGQFECRHEWAVWSFKNGIRLKHDPRPAELTGVWVLTCKQCGLPGFSLAVHGAPVDEPRWTAFNAHAWTALRVDGEAFFRCGCGASTTSPVPRWGPCPAAQHTVASRLILAEWNGFLGEFCK